MEMKELQEEEIVEIEDVDVGLKKEDVTAVKKENARKVKEQHVLNKEQQKIFNQILREAKMPVKLKDSEFKLGENELDIRGLSASNRTQMLFRELTLENIYLKQCLTSLVDISRLLMVIADFMGVKDIIGATDDIIDKLDKENKIREKLKKDKKASEKDESADPVD